MKKLALAVVALGVSALSARAADFPVKAPIAPIVAPFSWTGFYVGGNVGGGWGDTDASFTANDPIAASGFTNGASPPPGTGFHTSGALGGLQLGYNYQVGSNWLVGLETDFDWSDVKGSGVSGGVHGVVIPFTMPVDESTRWFGTVRARLGYLPTPKLLAYVTGGFAYGRVDQSGSWSNNSAGFLLINAVGHLCGPGICWAGSSGSTNPGWTAGAGLEYAIWQSWTLKAEYLFVNLNDNTLRETAIAPGSPTPSSFSANFSHNLNVVRVGLNYQFNSSVLAGH